MATSRPIIASGSKSQLSSTAKTTLALFANATGVTIKESNAAGEGKLSIKIFAVNLAARIYATLGGLLRLLTNTQSSLNTGGIQSVLDMLREKKNDDPEAAQSFRTHNDDFIPLAASVQESRTARKTLAETSIKNVAEVFERIKTAMPKIAGSPEPELTAGSEPIIGPLKRDMAAVEKAKASLKRLENNDKQIQNHLDTLRARMGRDPAVNKHNPDLAKSLTRSLRQETEQESQGVHSRSSRGGG